MDSHHKVGAISLSLSQVSDISTVASGWKGSPKISINLTNNATLKLSFKSGGRDTFLNKFNMVMNSRAWESKSTTEAPKKKEFSTSKAGITGIIRTVDAKSKETDQTLQQAFTDLTALMEKAKDLVGIAEKLSQQQNKDSSEEGNQEDSELRSMLISIGISSPVTKESAGSLYHSQLSRQLADWLQKPLQRFGGMMQMTDVYCYFNRARGTELVSPEDLYRACVLFEELKVPVRLRRFESGVLVIQSLSHTDEAIAKDIGILVKRDGPQTAFDLARTKNISLPLANEQLLTAEKQGVLCRDETYDGVTFYLNFFNDSNLLKLYMKT